MGNFCFLPGTDSCILQLNLEKEQPVFKKQQFELYQIRFGDKIKPEIEYSITESGFVKKNISLSGKTYGFLSVTYINENNKNEPVEINKNQIVNVIMAENIIHSKNTDFTTFFQNFKNIYIVDFSDVDNELKLAKKVKIEFNPTL